MSRIKGITIELGGDTTKLDRALKDVDRSSRDLQKELRGVNYALRLDPKNVEMLAQKQKILSEQTENARQKLDVLKQAHEQASEQFKRGEISEEEFRKISREVAIAEGQLKGFEKQLADVNNTLKQTGEAWQQVGQKVTDVGKGFTKNVTAPIMATGAAAMVAWNEIDDALDGIALATGATGDAMDDLEKSFRDVYKNVPNDAAAVSAAIGEVNTQFDLQGDALTEASTQALRYADITGQEVSSAVIGVKKAMEVFNLEVEDSSMVMDVFAKASQDTGVGTDRLQEAVRRAGPQLKNMNLGFEESVVMMSEMEKNGIDSSTAMGYMSRATVNLAKDGKTLDQGLKELKDQLATTSDETERISLVSELFGTRAGPLMLDAIERGALDFEDFADRVGSAGNTVENTFEQTQDPADRFGQAFHSLKLIGYDLGETIQGALAPAIEWLTEKLQTASEWFENLSPGIQTAIVTIGGLLAAIGPVLIILGTLIKMAGLVMTAVSGIGAVFAAVVSPIGIAIALIVGLGIALWKNWDTVKEKASQLWAWLTDTFNSIKDSIVGAWNTVKNWTSETWASMIATISNLAESIRSKVVGVFNSVRDRITGVWDSVKSVTQNAWNSVRDFISAPIEKARDTVRNAISTVKNILSGTLSFPKIKLPRFSLTGKFSLAPPSVPKLSIDWYAKGAIFSKPTLFDTVHGIKGVGEAGPEVVAPLSKLQEMLDWRAGEIDYDRMALIMYQAFAQALKDNPNILSPDPRVFGRWVKEEIL